MVRVVRKAHELAVVERLELEGYVQPYSARRGGATWDFRSHGSLQATQDRGRWNSGRAARIYVNTGVADLAALNLSAEALEALRRFANVLP